MDQKGIDIESISQKLKLQHQQILEFLNRLDDETQELETESAQDIADRSVLSMSKESLFEQISQQGLVLRMVKERFEIISDASFGVCAGCGDDISTRSLEALPFTQYCLRCQENSRRRSAVQLIVMTGNEVQAACGMCWIPAISTAGCLASDNTSASHSSIRFSDPNRRQDSALG